MARRERRLQQVLGGFVAGFLATLLFHQPVLSLLNLAGMTAFRAYRMDPVPPLGVSGVLSLAFWGGIWGIILVLLISKRRKKAYWITAMLVGAIAPTLVAGLVIAPLRGQTIPADARASMLMMGLIVNAAWGMGTAIIARTLGVHR